MKNQINQIMKIPNTIVIKNSYVIIYIYYRGFFFIILISGLNIFNINIPNKIINENKIILIFTI